MPYTPLNILLTGGCGFIGSHLLDLILTTYPTSHVWVIDIMDYCATSNNLIEARHIAPDRVHFIEADYGSMHHMLHIMRTYNIDTVLHIAALSHVDRSFNNSIQFTQNNVVGTHALLEAAKQYGKLQRFYFQSTDEVSSVCNIGDEPVSTDVVLTPRNPYSSSKAACEMICKAYYYSYKLPIIITRLSNVYGPRQFPEKVIPKFVHLILQDKPIPIHGNGTQVRSFTYVTDAASAILTALQHGKVGGTYNLGSEIDYSVADIAKMLQSHFPQSKSIIYHVRDRNFQDPRYALKIEELYDWGWRAHVGIKEGLATTIEWIQSHKDWHTDIDCSLVAHPK